MEQSLASVAQQTLSNWEVIVVDDGSDKPDIIDSIFYKIIGIKGRVVHQNNQGLAAARNTGIAKASGHFLLCLDADDYLHQEFLAKTSAVLRNSKSPGVVCCWARHFGTQRDLLIPPSNIHLFWLLQRNLLPVTALFRKQIWKAIGGFDENMTIGHEDWEFWIRVCLAGYEFSCISEPLFYYRKSSNSMIPTMAKYRVDTIHYIRHKHSQIYFMPLKQLFTYSLFKDVFSLAILRFWLTSLFFRYMPKKIMRCIFKLYQKVVDQLMNQ